jgi:hypothetical protein
MGGGVWKFKTKYFWMTNFNRILEKYKNLWKLSHQIKSIPIKLSQRKFPSNKSNLICWETLFLIQKLFINFIKIYSKLLQNQFNNSEKVWNFEFIFTCLLNFVSLEDAFYGEIFGNFVGSLMISFLRVLGNNLWN